MIFPDVVLNCPDMPHWHQHRVVVQRELEMLGFVLDRKLSWTAHVKRAVEKARVLLARLQVCVRLKWGLRPRVVTQLWKGAVEPVLLNGVGVWAAALKRKGVVRALRGVQRIAALAKTRCFKTTSTAAALALAQFPPVDLVAQEAVILQYCHGTLRGDQEALQGDCKWSKRFTYVKGVLQDAGIVLGDVEYERRLHDFELPYPPYRKVLDISLGSREGWAEDRLTGLDAETGVIFTDGSKIPGQGVGAAFVAMDKDGVVQASGKFKLPDFSTNYQAEAVGMREGLEWVEEDEGRKAGKWVVATDGLAVLSAMQGGSRMTPLVAQVVDKAREGISFVYIPAHKGHAGNEKADELAKAAVEEGVRVEVQVPRGYTKGLARERTWRLWAAEWEAMRAEDEAKGEGERRRTYLEFAPSLEDLKAGVWDKKVDARVLQLVSGHCNLGEYLHRFGRRETPECALCGVEAETVAHYLLRCRRWDRERNEIMDLVKRDDETASLRGLLQEVDRLARFVKRTGRLEIRGRGEG
uniref:RNase H type-1 domain-containing protein n=1 Tax=Heterosigma akashiwo TaxID=2829 RepID=A0A7S3Y0N9_HETAK